MKIKQEFTNTKFNAKKIENQLKKENEFITNLFKSLPIPASAMQEELAEKEAEAKKNSMMTAHNGSSRAQTLDELQNRLKSMKGKKRMSYKEKLLKKGLKNKIKKRNKKDERGLKQKLIKVEKSNSDVKIKFDPDVANKPKKPIFNSEGKMVFSKFDFSGLGSTNEKKTEKDPRKILKSLERQKDKLKELVAQGDTEKAKELKEKIAWKNVIAKAGGEKVKDDPLLLKKSIKKREQQKKTSQKKWQSREEGVKKAKDERQKKRNDNLAKRKKDNKNTKLKKASNRGRIIPGF